MQSEAKKERAKVVCAMSGGVDSSVAAVLLKKAGFEVEGVFMRLLDAGSDDERRAGAVAKKLEIQFKILDLRGEFKARVVDRFITDTKKGLTPNPCAVCNPQIKFGLFLDKARDSGADFVATGHYCQIKKTKDGVFHLLKGKDKNKDQSYFLWRLTQKQLVRIIFPVGCFTKDEVRLLAKKWRLPSAKTRESQEACFAAGDMDVFLEKHCGQKPGKIVDEVGNVLGQHNGLWFYTIGQRKGIRLSGGPFYVIKKDFKKNRLIVTRNEKLLFSNIVFIDKSNWIAGSAPDLPVRVKTRIRYRAKEAVAVLRRSGKKYELEFAKPQFAATPGQSAVFYRGQELMGGGIILNLNLIDNTFSQNNGK